MALIRFSVILLLCSIEIESSNNLFDLTRRLRLLDPPTDSEVSTKIVSDQYFKQRIDHFNPTDTRVYNQRYYVNEDYYNEDSNHVFLMLGGEWEANTIWLNSGAWIDSAKKYGAILFYLEHRFYGQSQPFEDLSTENLQYLSAHQALADAANFIKGMNDKYNMSTSEAKWIVYGGSYAGTLASWIRHKYPHLVTGSVDSSGPLEAVLDFREYLQVVQEGLGTHSESCVTNVTAAFNKLDELLEGCLEDPEIYTELKSMFQLCDSIELDESSEKDLSSLFELMVDNNFAYAVQYNGRSEISIDNVCTIMTNDTADTSPLQKLGEVNSLVLKSSGSDCLSFDYEKFVLSHQNTTLPSSSMSRQWLYQTCTEFGFFQTSSQTHPIFSSRFDVTFFTDLCLDVFGAQFTASFTSAAIHATNVRYGGVKAPITNVVHFHSRIDPWHALGKLKTTDDARDWVIIVDDASHCASMYSISDTDSVDLANAKKEIDRLVGVWLKVIPDDSTGSASSTAASFYMFFIFTIVRFIE
ncbi:putative serine protease K12H4.7 [Euwallacea fornicatus]|uniref:putative serine protease K12H4.7 n=1 Tax=Euwallacea fornicatus TaxID=995702 RepID=UPI00338F939F